MLTAFLFLIFQSGAWESIPAMPDERQEVGVAALEGRIVVVGGIAPDRLASSAVSIYDTRTNRWSAGPPLPVAVHHAMVAAIGNRIYVAGGYAEPGFTPVALTWELDADQDRWVRKADMPTRRGAGAAVGFGGRLYVFGGERGTSVNETAVYDPATDRWSSLAAMPTPRNHHGAAVVRGRMYVVGGRPGNLANNEVYDPAADRWETRASLRTARSGIAVASLGAFVYVFGGEGNPSSPVGTFSENEAYNAETNEWLSLPPMPLPRHGIGAAVVGNRIYIPSGSPVEGFGTTAESDAFVVAEDLLLPQFAVGGGYTTEIVVANPSAARAAGVTLTVRQASGAPFETALDGPRRSTVTFTIPPLASRTIWAPDSSGILGVGTVRVQSVSRLSAFAVVRGPGVPPVTVYPAVQARNLLFHVKRVVAEQRTTGIAVANVSEEQTTATLALVDASGNEVTRVVRPLQPGEQFSRFIHEIFPNLAGDLAGTMTVRGGRPLSVLALAFEPGGAITIPVTVIE